jgi:hypothetical protein
MSPHSCYRNAQDNCAISAARAAVTGVSAQGSIRTQEIRADRGPRGHRSTPAVVAGKVTRGDWEFDTIVGSRRRGVLISMVERGSKLVRLALVQESKSSRLPRRRNAVSKKTAQSPYPHHGQRRRVRAAQSLRSSRSTPFSNDLSVKPAGSPAGFYRLFSRLESGTMANHTMAGCGARRERNAL